MAPACQARHHVRAIPLTAKSFLTLICWRLGHFFQRAVAFTGLRPAASPTVPPSTSGKHAHQTFVPGIRSRQQRRARAWVA